MYIIDGNRYAIVTDKINMEVDWTTDKEKASFIWSEAYANNVIRKYGIGEIVKN